MLRMITNTTTNTDADGAATEAPADAMGADAIADGDGAQWDALLSTMKASVTETRMVQLAQSFIDLACADDILCDMNDHNEPGKEYRAVMAAMALCRMACDEIEEKAREAVASNAQYYRAQVARYEIDGLLAIADGGE